MQRKLGVRCGVRNWGEGFFFVDGTALRVFPMKRRTLRLAGISTADSASNTNISTKKKLNSYEIKNTDFIYKLNPFSLYFIAV